MRKTIADVFFTVDEYIQGEWNSENKHEYINGRLYPMAGEKIKNNQIAIRLLFILMKHVQTRGFEGFMQDIKVKIPMQDRFYYPDLFLVQVGRVDANAYFNEYPVLIAEVVSPSTRSIDYIDKYIDYIKIPSLKYYFIIEADTLKVTLHERVKEDWISKTFSHLDDEIELSFFELNFKLSELY